jgi:hypothetical protein
MLVTFEYSLFYGKGHYGEACVEAEISEEEYERLHAAYESGEDFINCELVKDIYNRVYEVADEEATNDLILEGILEDGKKASELYPITVYYPEE